MISAGADNGLQGAVPPSFLAPKNGGSSMPAAAIGGRVLSRAEVDAALERLRAEEDEISAALLELEDHPGYRLLKGAVLTGLTLERWTTAQTVIGTLWEGLGAHQETVQAAADLRARRQHPGAAELAELTQLLTGASVELAGPEIPLERRGLLQGPRQTEHLTLAALVARMNSTFTAVTKIVASADDAWSQEASRLRHIESAWRAATELVQTLELRPDEDPTASAVERIGTDLTSLRTTVNSDPLSAWRDGTLDTGPFDRLQSAADAARSDLERAAQVRAQFEPLAAKVSALISSVATDEDRLRAATGQVQEKIAGSPVAGAPDVAPALQQRLTALSSLPGGGRWPELATQLDRLRRDAAAAAENARAALANVMAPLADRDELRGRLEAYRAKATRRGLAEDLGLAEGYRRARDLLWTAPCDLDQARAAVLAYQKSVASHPAPPAGRDGRPAARGNEEDGPQ
jgi:hypothetical protein